MKDMRHHATIGHDVDCSSYFLEETQPWMDDDLLAEGKIHCPSAKCQSRLGALQWSGSQCSCGTWVTPSIKITKSRVDPVFSQPSVHIVTGVVLPNTSGYAAVQSPPEMATASDGESPIRASAFTPTVYELVPLDVLPSFDPSKSLKMLLLTTDQVQRFDGLKKRWRVMTAPMLQLGNLLMLLTTVAPQPFGSVLAIVAPLLQLPGLLIIAGSMRVEMLRLLFTTYDFWYFTFNNLVFGFCFAAMLADIRIVMVVFGCVIVQISIGADALVGDRLQLLLSSAINCGTHFAMSVVVMLRRVPDASGGDALLVSYSTTDFGLSVRDTLVNAQVNMILLFGRLVYRNWVTIREQNATAARRISANVSVISSRRCCVSYYCRVGLRQQGTSTADATTFSNVTVFSNASANPGEAWGGHPQTLSRTMSIQALPSVDKHRSAPSAASCPPLDTKDGDQTLDVRHERADSSPIRSHKSIQLQFVPISQQFAAHHTVVPGFGRLLTRLLAPTASPWRRRVLLGLLHMLGVGGFAGLASGALLAWMSGKYELDQLRAGLERTQTLAFAASVIFCAVFFASYQRRLLRRLYSSFNFLFLSTKLTVASLALSLFFAGDHRTHWVWGAWLWMHWAITLDAMPPNVMHLLAFRRSTLMLSVLVLMLLALILLSLELFVWGRWIVPDRAVVERTLFGRHMKINTLTPLVARLWTIFLWDCKLMWLLLAALWRQRQRRLVGGADTCDVDEGECLLLSGRVEFFYEWATHRKVRAKQHWSHGVRMLRVPRAFMRRRVTAAPAATDSVANRHQESCLDSRQAT
ncbi:hypothetical protein BBJ28_00006268 [Nothophytophthora sp. Chile5]|nr:hypothetical protein BBJ28_00006268 [Nothophytophthora sp. Chile5]